MSNGKVKTERRERISPIEETALPTSEELSFDDFFTDTDGLRRVEIPNHKKDGKPGVVYIQWVTARPVIRRQGKSKNMPDEWASELISLAVVDSQRRRIFDTPEKAQKVADVDLPTYLLLQRETMIHNGMVKEEDFVEKDGDEDDSKNDGALS